MTAVMPTGKEDTKLRLDMQASPPDGDSENHIDPSEWPPRIKHRVSGVSIARVSIPLGHLLTVRSWVNYLVSQCLSCFICGMVTTHTFLTGLSYIK